MTSSFLKKNNFFQIRKFHDVVVIGGGISGSSIAARLQIGGLRTTILESHSILGGCAGYFEKDGFSFDVGATTFVDFEKGGVGGEFLESIGMKCPLENSEVIPGYKFHLPEGEGTTISNIKLFKDKLLFSSERETVFGSDPRVKEFWRIMDKLAQVFWFGARRGIKMPIQSLSDLIGNALLLSPDQWILSRYLYWTVGDLFDK